MMKKRRNRGITEEALEVSAITTSPAEKVARASIGDSKTGRIAFCRKMSREGSLKVKSASRISTNQVMQIC